MTETARPHRLQCAYSLGFRAVGTLEIDLDTIINRCRLYKACSLLAVECAVGGVKCVGGVRLEWLNRE